MEEYGWSNLGKRHIVVLMGFLFLFFLTAHRLLMAVAIISMVSSTQKHTANNASQSCPLLLYEEDNSTTTSGETQISGEFDWDSLLQSYILSANFLGYIFTQLLGGRMAERFGAKMTLVSANMLTALLTFVAPAVAHWGGAYPLVVVQLLKGLTQGVSLPAVFVMMGLWIPKSERSLLNSMVMNGYSIGSLFGGAVTGWLCSIPQMGWESSFYVMGALTVLLSVVFYLLHSETPKSHPGISKEELDYITSGQEDDMSRERPPAPWRAILTSIPVYSVIFGYAGNFWILAYFTAAHPAYVGTVLHYPIQENGYISTLPILGQAITTFFCSVFANWITKNQCLKINVLRKGSCAISTLGFCVMLVGVYVAGCDHTINLVFMILAGCFSGVAVLGAPITPVDMSPRFAGSVSGLAMSVSGITAIVCPVVIGAMTRNATLEEWQQTFLVSIAFILICGIIFVVFGSAEVQPWNYIDKEKEQIQTIFTVSKNFQDCVPTFQTDNAKTISFVKHKDSSL